MAAVRRTRAWGRGRDTAERRVRLDWYAATWRLPMVLWQVLFFAIPLGFLVYLSFWLVRNYRMVPGFDVVNWVSMYGKDYFWDAYGLTFGLAAASTLVTSLIAFPCAYALAFKVSDTARRWAIFFLIIPFFTSYLVRIYAWQVIMNDGRIAQIGSPREVYRNPANRFVAEFVGTNNILTGRVSGLSAERIGIDTDLGRFQAARPDRLSLEDGKPATFVVSADLVQLSGVGAALENRIACSLISEEFVGSMVTLFLETADGVEFKVQTSQRILERLDLSGATTLFASWSPEHVHILPGEQSARSN